MRWIDLVGQDVRFACRMARRNPLLTCTVVATLALGVGLDAGIFTILDGAVRKPRVQYEPESFVHVQVNFESPTRRSTGDPFSTTSADYFDYRDSATSLRELAAWHVVRGTIGQDAKPTLTLLVSCNFFAVYGLSQPLMGRLLTPDDCAHNNRVVLISE